MSTTVKWLASLGLLTALTIFAIVTLSRAPEEATTEQHESPLAQETPPDPSEEPVPTPFEAIVNQEVVAPPTPIAKELPTPIPIGELPLIPEAAGREERSFWIYYWFDNEVWRIDSEGNDREKLLDTYEQVEQWLTGHPVPNTDCCWSGPRVVVSPDGRKLALVVVDKINVGKASAPFQFSIYTFDLESRELQRISTGVQPVWSPDSIRIAFFDGNALYVSDLAAGKIRKVAVLAESHQTVSEYAWSTDGQRIAYTVNEGFPRLPILWLANVDAVNPPRKLAEFAVEHPPYGLAWTSDSTLLFLSSAGSRDHYPQNQFRNLSSIALHTKQPEPMTSNMVVQNYHISPDQQWIAIAGYFPHEQQPNHYQADVWFQDVERLELRRGTTNSPGVGIVGWTPDGTRLLLWQPEGKPAFLSLKEGSVTEVDFALAANYAIGGLK